MSPDEVRFRGCGRDQVALGDVLSRIICIVSGFIAAKPLAYFSWNITFVVMLMFTIPVAVANLSLIYGYVVPKLCDVVVYNVSLKIVSFTFSERKCAGDKPALEFVNLLKTPCSKSARPSAELRIGLQKIRSLSIYDNLQPTEKKCWLRCFVNLCMQAAS